MSNNARGEDFTASTTLHMIFKPHISSKVTQTREQSENGIKNIHELPTYSMDGAFPHRALITRCVLISWGLVWRRRTKQNTFCSWTIYLHNFQTSDYSM